ncbi:uncharacterized protein LOC125234710 [Leguminivora glycinivorella]|uniref:uncharacterized protein LOC125234710 n=1 Tax=Leguminivora glycinivorella TaxID=1035111 RepID=UPI0020108CD9|nr:uncharacterized protein LOC125234710 [Leguminivora glycinivorella]
MAFLSPFFMERKTQDSVDVESDNESSDKIDENNTVEFTASENIGIDIDDCPANVSDEQGILNESKQQKCVKIPKAVKRRVVRSQQSASAVLMAKLLDQQNKSEPSREHDEIDHFFLAISQTVKKFSPYVQALAKNKIFSLVSEMELQHLAPPSSSQYSSNPSPSSVMSLPTSTDTPMPTSPYWNEPTSLSNNPDWNVDTEDY